MSSSVDPFELKEKFSAEFFNEFQYDSEFRSIFTALTQGWSVYQAIEHLCKTKKELIKDLESSIKNTPTKILVTTEELEQIKKGFNQQSNKQ